MSRKSPRIPDSRNLEIGGERESSGSTAQTPVDSLDFVFVGLKILIRYAVAIGTVQSGEKGAFQPERKR